MNNSKTSPFTSLSLKIVGIILIISALIDYVALAIPFDALNPNVGVQWQIDYIGGIVDRGIIPLIGIILLLLAYWIDCNAVDSPKKSSLPDLRLPIFLLASVFGLIFLLFAPLYWSNLNKAEDNLIARIEQRATQQEEGLQRRYELLVDVSKDPQALERLKESITRIDGILESGTFQGRALSSTQRRQLEQDKTRRKNVFDLANDSERLDKAIKETQQQIRSGEQERKQRAKTLVLKQGFRVSLSSALLAIGYSIIGFLGLAGFKNMVPRQPSRSKASQKK